jgi:hypothetical protein
MRRRAAVPRAALVKVTVLLLVAGCSDSADDRLSGTEREALRNGCEEAQEATETVEPQRLTCDDLVDRVVRMTIERFDCSVEEALTFMNSEATYSLDGPTVYESLPCVQRAIAND